MVLAISCLLQDHSGPRASIAGVRGEVGDTVRGPDVVGNSKDQRVPANAAPCPAQSSIEGGSIILYR